MACSAKITTSGIGPSKIIHFPAPVITGGAEPVSFTCTPASATAFPLGTTSVSCVATDALSRTATCGFDVTVNNTQLGAKRFSAAGDSLTEGENGQTQSISPKTQDPANSYPIKLQALFDAAFPGQGITVFIHGFGGWLASQTLADLPTYLSADHPEAVLVLTGYNDLLNHCRIGYTDNAGCDQAIDDIESGVRGIIRTAKAFAGVRYVFIATLTPGRPGSRYLDPLRVQDANDHIRGVVAAEGATLVDLYPVFVTHENEYVSIDGLHLNPAGYQAIAQTFFDKILATVPQTSPQGIPQFIRR